MWHVYIAKYPKSFKGTRKKLLAQQKKKLALVITGPISGGARTKFLSADKNIVDVSQPMKM